MIASFLLATAAVEQTHFELGRSFSGITETVLPLVVLFLLIYNTVVMVRRDCRELGGHRATLLITLRTLAIFGVFIVYLQPQWRSTRELTDRSQVFVLVDTSQSMSREDVPRAEREESGLTAPDEGRLERIVRELEEGDLLERIRQVHDVVVYRFDEDENPVAIATLPRIPAPEASEANAEAITEEADPRQGETNAAEPIAWREILKANGGDTRLGDALRELYARSRGLPLAGMIILSDGAQTAGTDLETVTDLYGDAEVPLYSIGLGQTDRPPELLLVDFAAPPRAYPHDPLEVTAYIRARGLEGRRATLHLRQLPASEVESATGDEPLFEDQIDITLGDDASEVVPITMEIDTLDRAGRYLFEWDLQLRGAAASAGRNAEATAESRQNRRRFEIEVQSKPTRVLLVAGGPSREYQFLRNMLKRDTRHIQLEVLLQSRPEASLKDPSYLRAFPDSEALSKYDVLIAIDPEWDRLGPRVTSAIERWVADEAGGLILVPGIVNAGSPIQSWSHDPDYQPLRDLYPVVFEDDFEIFEDGTNSTSRLRAVRATRDGRDAAFMQLADSPLATEQVWDQFRGVYGPKPVKGKKYGATVYALFEDTLADSLGREPIYCAGQFYGKGRVFYQASGEMWRIRRLDTAYFEKWYTQMIRHVSAGRLHQGSPRGDVLLVEKDTYRMGDTIPIAAQLKDAARKPYSAKQVTLFLFSAAQATEGEPLTLVADPARPGTFRGEWTARKAGTYRMELAIPESDYDPLSRSIKVLDSDRERARPEQDREALQQLAAATEGRYFTSIEMARGDTGEPPLPGMLIDQTRMTPLQGDIDAIWAARFSRWMLLGICSLLCFEWLLRRFFRLA